MCQRKMTWDEIAEETGKLRAENAELKAEVAALVKDLGLARSGALSGRTKDGGPQ